MTWSAAAQAYQFGLGGVPGCLVRLFSPAKIVCGIAPSARILQRSLQDLNSNSKGMQAAIGCNPPAVRSLMPAKYPQAGEKALTRREEMQFRKPAY